MPTRRDGSRRRATTMVEMAVILVVFLTLVLGMLEMAIAIFRYHVVSQAARQGARAAIVHGNLAAANGEMTNWFTTYGPTYGPQVVADAVASDEIINGTVADHGTRGMKNYMAGLDFNATEVTMEWLSDPTTDDTAACGGVGCRVRATVRTEYAPFVTFLFSSNWTLTGQSTMQIAH